jgi:hypothetical protein
VNPPRTTEERQAEIRAPRTTEDVRRYPPTVRSEGFRLSPSTRLNMYYAEPDKYLNPHPMDAEGLAFFVSLLAPEVRAGRAVVSGVSLVGRAVKSVRGGSSAAKAASTPVGRRGQPITVVTRNGRARIRDRVFTGHALDRMQGRGIMPSVVEEAIRNGVRSRQGLTKLKFFDPNNKITVVTSRRGRVITVGHGEMRRGR